MVRDCIQTDTSLACIPNFPEKEGIIKNVVLFNIYNTISLQSGQAVGWWLWLDRSDTPIRSSVIIVIVENEILHSECVGLAPLSPADQEGVTVITWQCGAGARQILR